MSEAADTLDSNTADRQCPTPPRHGKMTTPEVPACGGCAAAAGSPVYRVRVRNGERAALDDRTSIGLANTLSFVTVDELSVDVERLAEICQRFGVARLDVFGSFARGEAGTDSDVDLLYELAPGRQLGWELEDLNEELEAAFGRPVDLIARRAVHPRLRDDVSLEAQSLYAA
jgi:hypothetical protein